MSEIMTSVTTNVDLEIGDGCREELFKVFKEIDKNKDDKISFGELKEFLDTQEHIIFPEKCIRCVYRNFHRNKNDQMDFKEFMAMVHDPRFKREFKKTTRSIWSLVASESLEHCKLRRADTLTGTFEKKIHFRNMLCMTIITVIQIGLHYSNMAYKDEKDPLIEALQFDPCRKLEIHRYATYVFVHSNDWHLFANMVIQVLVGIPLSLVHGWRVMVVYFAGAVGGCVTHSVFRRTRPLRGASGAVFSFYTAHIAAVIMNWREMSHPGVHLIIFGVIVTIDGVYTGLADLNHEVSYPCHTGGAVIGLLLGILILRNIRETRGEKVLWHLCLNVLGILVTAFILLDICLPLAGIREEPCPIK